MVARNATEWAELVKKNANYRCEWCGATVDLLAHHNIDKNAYALEEMFNPNYGICLCRSCHKNYHDWSKHTFKYEFKSKVWRKKK